MSLSNVTKAKTMVVSVLVNRFAPSSRGFERFGKDARTDVSEPTGTDMTTSTTTAGSGPRRKPFRAVSALTSLASDLDVISDWVFFFETANNQREYHQELQANPDPAAPQNLIPPLLITLTLVSCIFGTIMYLILATDGRFVAPILRQMGFDKLSIGHMLFICVILEDIPQVVLTFLVEDYYEDPDLSGFAVLNLTMSLYDTLIKLAEAYDERHDIVETGSWCKTSLWAHKSAVTSVLILPLPPSALEYSSSSMSMNESELWGTRAESRNNRTVSSTRQVLPHTLRRMTASQNRMTSNSSLMDEAFMKVSPVELPRLRFLTTSLDKTVRLWDTSITMKGHRREKCLRVYRGHTDGVTCVALLGTPERRYLAASAVANTNLDDRDEETEQTTFFLTGCRNGNTKLWSLKGNCLRSYYPVFIEKQSKGVTDVVVIESGTSFCCSYDDGSIRLWEAWSGLCIAIYRGHTERVSCLCSLHDGNSFLSGSSDATVKLWKTEEARRSFSAVIEKSDSKKRESTAKMFQEDEVFTDMVCTRSYQPERDPSPVLCVASVDTGSTFVSGSADGVIRLWAVEASLCIREFLGHSGPVSALSATDPTTFLSGSKDNDVKVWDALSGVCLRTYQGHTNDVTDIDVADDEHTFITASVDRTVKLWVITSVLPEMPPTGPQRL